MLSVGKHSLPLMFETTPPLSEVVGLLEDFLGHSPQRSGWPPYKLVAVEDIVLCMTCTPDTRMDFEAWVPCGTVSYLFHRHSRLRFNGEWRSPDGRTTVPMGLDPQVIHVITFAWMVLDRLTDHAHPHRPSSLPVLPAPEGSSIAALQRQ